MILPLATAAAVQPDEVRLAVVVSSNHGLPGEEPLKYADRDAERVAELLRTLGRYGAGDVWVVPSADTADLFATLARVTVRAQEVANGGGSASLLVFYAGHAGVDGLHLGGEVLPLPDLKSAIRVVPAADRIVVLDACNAGTIARSRGAALVDVRDQPVGFAPPEDEAWMASSGPEERSFEVEDRRGALFTHFFLSGARGAADLDADQRVTLGELYGFVQVHTAEAAAGLGQLQQPRWAGVLGDFALTDLSASATGVRVVGPVADPLLVIDERAQEVVAEVPRGGGANLALPPGSYQMVAVRDDGVSLGRLAVPADGWTLWTPAQELGRASSVRTRGGFYDTTPWGASLGYELGLGTAPGRFDAHGGHLSLHRALGGGHALAIGVGGAFVPTTTQGWVGSERRGELSLGWTREVAGRAVTLAPGFEGVGGWSEVRSERAPDPVWGAWYGADTNRAREQRVYGALRAGAELGAPLGPVSVRSWWAVGLGFGRADGLAVTPSVVGRVSLEVPFR